MQISPIARKTASAYVSWCVISWWFRETIGHTLQHNTNIWQSKDKSRFPRVMPSLQFGNMNCVYWYRHWYATALALPQACWDWRNWCAAFSSPGRRCQSGCWMTTWTLHRCWRRSVTTKWRPSSLMLMHLFPITSLRRSALHAHSLDLPTYSGYRSYSCVQTLWDFLLFNAPMWEIQVSFLKGTQSLLSVNDKTSLWIPIGFAFAVVIE